MQDFLLYNTLSRQKEKFTPLNDNKVTLYACGPTVYHYVHIGNLRTFTMVDLLKRVLLGQGYHVDHVMNITDVGHLTQEDLDSGDDKIEKAAAKEGKTPEQIAEFYTDEFLKDLHELAIIPPSVMPKASDHVEQMINMVELLTEKGIAYESEQAIYFDVTQYDKYTELSGQKLEDKKLAAREEITVDPQKKNPADFALWFKAVGKFQHHLQQWNSPWGKGFPGWHIECSAMAEEYLGKTIDIHAGGVDLIGTHHTNERAQSELANDELFVRYWFHVEHLLINETTMSKSAGTGFRLEDLKEKGISAETFRYLLYTAHYRSKLNFSWESLQSAQKTLQTIRQLVAGTPENAEVNKELKQKVWSYLLDDLDTPKALAVLHEAGDGALWREFEFVLGFNFNNDADDEVLALLAKRNSAREAKNWAESDRLRGEIEELGWKVVDDASGSYIHKL